MKKTSKKMEHNYIFCEYCAKKINLLTTFALNMGRVF